MTFWGPGKENLVQPHNVLCLSDRPHFVCDNTDSTVPYCPLVRKTCTTPHHVCYYGVIVPVYVGYNVCHYGVSQGTMSVIMGLVRTA